MKFKKFPERMELLSKATEKSNATVLSMRRLSEALNFQSYKVSYEQYSGPVIESYRDALDNYEKSLYPHEHDKYMKEAIKIANATRDREETHDDEIEKLLNTDRKERLSNNQFPFPHDVQLDTPEDTPNVGRPPSFQDRIGGSDTDSEDGIVPHNVKIDIKQKESKSSIAKKNVEADVIPPETPASTGTEVSHDITSWLPKEVLAKREDNKKLKEQQQHKQK